jgi:hemerythrin
MPANLTKKTPYPVGLEEIDSQHGYFFFLLDELEIAVQSQVTLQLPALIEELVRYAKFHFSCEESLMTNYGYDASERHFAQHKALLGRVTTMLSDPSVKAGELWLFLNRWIIDHIRVEDTALGAFVTNQRRETLSKLQARMQGTGT